MCLLVHVSCAVTRVPWINAFFVLNDVFYDHTSPLEKNNIVLLVMYVALLYA
jgi:hypothetical protein